MNKDTRNNWITMMFVCKCRYNCLRKQSVMNTCVAAFREFERNGFEFGPIGFGGNHTHFRVNIPKKYSIMNAEIMLKSRSSKRIFEKHPNFRKRYSGGSFWSGYEHHESTGKKDMNEADDYILSQEMHHEVKVINDVQKNIFSFTAEQDTTYFLKVAE
ncbi:transposase [Candidatus Woesearchaeota archaeon]|nr:transposase [Candidatus Woesearchaeota archaeon]